MESGLFPALSQLFKSPALVEVSAALVVIYIVIILAAFTLYYVQDMWFIWRLNQSLRQSLRTGDLALAYENLIGAAGLDEHGNIIGTAEEEYWDKNRHLSRFAKAYWSLVKRNTPRTKALLRSMLKTFVTLEADRHFVENIRPLRAYFRHNDPGPKVDVTGFFNTLVRLSLAVTFAGIAGILFIAGVNIGDISQGRSDASELSTQVLDIITSSSNKFWITAIGYGLGNVMLIIAQVMESYRMRRVSVLCERIDVVLDSDEAQLNVRERGEGLSAAQRSKLESAFIENINAISSMGKAINDELVAKLSNMAMHNQEITEKILTRISASFAEIRESGVRIPIQSAISDEINGLLQLLVQEVAASSDNVRKLHELMAKRDGRHTSKARPTQSEAKRNRQPRDDNEGGR